MKKLKNKTQRDIILGLKNELSLLEKNFPLEDVTFVSYQVKSRTEENQLDNLVNILDPCDLGFISILKTLNHEKFSVICKKNYLLKIIEENCL